MTYLFLKAAQVVVPWVGYHITATIRSVLTSQKGQGLSANIFKPQ